MHRLHGKEIAQRSYLRVVRERREPQLKQIWRHREQIQTHSLIWSTARSPWQTGAKSPNSQQRGDLKTMCTKFWWNFDEIVAPKLTNSANSVEFNCRIFMNFHRLGVIGWTINCISFRDIADFEGPGGTGFPIAPGVIQPLLLPTLNALGGLFSVVVHFRRCTPILAINGGSSESVCRGRPTKHQFLDSKRRLSGPRTSRNSGKIRKLSVENNRVTEIPN